jgi:hypothetical protein
MLAGMSIGYLFALTSRARWDRAAALTAVESGKGPRDSKKDAAPLATDPRTDERTDQRPTRSGDKPARGPAPK